MKKIILLFASLIAFGSSFAQTTASAGHNVNVIIPTVSLIALSEVSARTLTYVAPSAAGANMADVTNTGTLFVRYSSMMSSTSTAANRSIYVTSTAIGTNYAGIRLNVTATVPATNGTTSNGIIGTTNGPVSIIDPNVTNGLTSSGTAVSTSPKVIVNIQSGYTGTGAADGASLQYTSSLAGLTAAQYGSLRAATYAVTVNYTLSDTI